jgi:hypothetical protein
LVAVSATTRAPDSNSKGRKTCGGKTWVRILAARFARVLSERFALFDQRAWGMPDARCTRSLVCAWGNKYAHEYSQRATGITRHSRTRWFTAYTALSPVIGFLATVISGVASTDLTPASGCQDHTSSPSAASNARQARRRVHRIPPQRPVTFAKRPSEWDGMARDID